MIEDWVKMASTCLASVIRPEGARKLSPGFTRGKPI
jgi:hypothetical protein